MKASIIFLAAFCASIFQAGFASAREPKSVQDFIKKAHQKGEIDLDEALVLQARSILQPETLPGIWKTYPIEVLAGRYLTHLLCDIRLNWEKLREETRKALQPLLMRPTDASYMAFGVDWAYASGTTVLNFETAHFVIHYVNTTADAPNLTDDDSDGHPNYVESMGTEFENVYTNEITTMGYTNPPSDGTLGGNSKFDVYIKNIGSIAYGWAHAEGSANGNSWYSFMVMDNDYSTAEFTSGASGMDALRVTAAHEFHHAVQNGYDVTEESWFKEATSTWIEDEVYDGINDNLQYLSSWFSSPESSLDDASDTHEYGSWIWLRYLSERFGRNLIRSIWEATPSATAIAAMSSVLTTNGTTLQDAFADFIAKNYNKSWYEEGASYPNITVANSSSPHNSYPTGTSSLTLDHLASRYYRFVPDSSDSKVRSLEISVNGPDGIDCGANILKISPTGAISQENIALDATTKDGKNCIEDFGGEMEAAILVLSNGSTSSDSQTFSYEAKYCNEADIIFAIDTTGSMWDDIAAVKQAATDIVNEIDSKPIDYRIAVMSYEDFPVYPYGDAWCGDWTYHDVLPFSNEKNEIISAIQSLYLRCGADWPEAVLSALMHAIDSTSLGSWRENVVKAIILMGDAPPHDPEPFTGFTSANIIDAAEAADPVQIYPVVIGFDPSAKAAFSIFADGTKGKLFEAPTASEVVDAVIEAIDVIVTPSNLPPNCSFAIADKTNLWPPNHKFVLIQIQGITDPDGDQVFIEVTEIMQDEPVSDIGIGSGSTCPDGVIVDGDGDEIPELVGVRVERAGNPNMFGNGRVYTISFTASDGNGGTCSGTIQTCAAHDQGANTSCVDDGPNYDSTSCPGGGALIERKIYSLDEFYQLTPEPLFLRGDIQIDYERDISDAILLLSTLFLGRQNLLCADSADINDDGNLDVSDAISLLGFLFRSSQFIPEPSSQIGSDPTPDQLGCSYE